MSNIQNRSFEFEELCQAATEAQAVLSRYNIITTVIGSLAIMFNFKQTLIYDKALPMLAPPIDHNDVDLLVRGHFPNELETILKNGAAAQWVKSTEKRTDKIIRFFLKEFPDVPVELHFGSIPRET
jgi:hypothetical protein